MNLPHREPLIFAKEVLLKKNDTVQVRCEFPMLPTLAMFIEAAAQSSAAFHPDSDSKEKIGFLTLANNVKLLGKIETLHFLFHLKKEVEVGPYKKFSFEVYDNNMHLKIANGKFTLLIQE